MNSALYSAIFKRKSVRKYSDQWLTEKQLSEIEEILNNLQPLKEDISFKAHFFKDGKRLHETIKGVIGNYGKIIAPHYIVVTSEVKNGYLTNVGYAIERVVLEMTAMGIANCWIGGNVNHKDIKSLMNLSEGKEPIIIISLGNAEDKAKAFRQDISEFKRKELSEIVIGEVNDTWRKILEAARLAPSAANTQPWRFIVEDKKVHVYRAEGNFITKKMFERMNKIDIGIALCHISIAAKELGKEIRFVDNKLDSKDKMVYVMSVEEV